MPDTRPSYTYKVYDLEVRSFVPLYPLREVEGAREDVSIALSQAPLIDSGDRSNLHYHTDAEGTWLQWDAAATFLVKQGRQILVEPLVATGSPILSLPLLGPVFAVILHQRRRLVLHGSAVRVGNKCAAFLGHSGAGKSTTAAALYSRGHSLTSDDKVVIDAAVGERVSHLPGLLHFKLSPDAAAASLGGRAQPVRELSLETGKEFHLAHEAQLDATHPLDAVFFLEFGESMALERLSQSQALLGLLEHSFSSRLHGDSGEVLDRQWHLQECGRVARGVPAYRLRRPYSLAGLPQVVELVERCLQDQEAAS